MACRSCSVGLLVGFLVGGCGGISEERVATLESQLSSLKEASHNHEGGTDNAALEQRVAKAEAANEEATKRLESELEAVQGEVTKMAAASKAEESSGSSAGVWIAVDEIFGTGGEAVVVQDDSYAVSRAWLAQEVQALAIVGKVPKLAAVKRGGVSIKGVKPKTLGDALGFKNNDIVTAVGEKEITSAADIVAALKAANGTSPLVVKVTRKKKELVLRYLLVD